MMATIIKGMNAMLYLDLQNGGELLKDMLTFQALPEFLQQHPRFAGQTLLYFYSPARPTVICGHFQNVYREVDLSYLRAHEIALVRRNSGGGAVYVDAGDLTYVYIAPAGADKNAQLKQYLQPILAALRELGIDAQMTGRNDLTYRGRKFSGMSFAKVGKQMSYGGTLMFDVDMATASHVLTPSPAKLANRGIHSVRQRVINLKPYLKQAGFTVKDLQVAILRQVARVNDLQTTQLTSTEWAAVQTLAQQKYGQPSWIYGHNRTPYYVDAYFPGVGNFGIGFAVQAQRLSQVSLAGDLLTFDQSQATALEKALSGVPLAVDPIKAVLQQGGLATALAPSAPALLAAKMVAARAHEN